MALIECKEVSFSYEGESVIENISFTINKGDYLCIIGENGSGKTTLMKGLLGLKMPSSGSIVYDKEVKKNQIGYIPQKSKIMMEFPASVYEIVISGNVGSLGGHIFYSKAQKNDAIEKMELLGIDGIQRTFIGELSGGWQQRVLLARALVAAKDILVLDEPVTGLDPLATSELYSIIDNLNKNMNMTIVMVSHDIEKAIEKGTHILHLADDTYYWGNTSDYINSDFYLHITGGQHRV